MFEERSSKWREKRLRSNVPNRFIGIAVQVEDATHTWCSMEVSEVVQCNEENEQNWNKRGAVV